MKINAQVNVYADQLVARFNNAPTAAMEAAMRVMDDVAEYIWNRVRDNLSGPILQIRSGRLRDSIQKTVVVNGRQVSAIIYSDGSVPYARIQEYGGQTSPHDIVVKNAKALRYEMDGAFHFSPFVHHPGSKIPEAMYLRSVLIRERTTAIRMIREGMKGAI